MSEKDCINPDNVCKKINIYIEKNIKKFYSF